MLISKTQLNPQRIVAALESVFAVICFVLATLLIVASYNAARMAERAYGHNVDSGAIAWFVAIAILIPLGTLLMLAAWSLWGRWRIRWWVQGGVGLGIVGLFYAVSRMMG